MSDSSAMTLPLVPSSLLSRFGLTGLQLRSPTVGQHVLDVNFYDSHLPRLVTQLLKTRIVDSNQQPCPEDFFWALTVGARVAWLLELTVSEVGAQATTQVRCRNPACASLLEVELPLRGIAQTHYVNGSPESVTVRLGQRNVSLRIPTGLDQCLLVESSNVLEKHEFLRRLLPPDVECSAEELRRCEQALAEVDPFIDFRVRAMCSDCGEESVHDLDLQSLALSLLRRRQHTLLTAVHTLASAYHWSERDIVILPHWRRAFYLNWLERESR